jgi:hypothetical protein
LIGERRKFYPLGYIEYLEDIAKASLGSQFETDPREIGCTSHGAGAEVGQKDAFCKGLEV